MKKKIYLLFLLICMLVMPNLEKALSDPVYLHIDEEYISLGYDKFALDDNTAIYDEVNGTLTLDNYHGGEISVFLDTDLTIILKGENVITAIEEEAGISTSGDGEITIEGEGSLLIKDGTEGFYIGSEKFEINSGTIIIEDAIDNGINANGTVIFNDGNLTIRSTTLENTMMGFYSSSDLTINGGTINIDNTDIGLYSLNDLTINGGKVVVNSEIEGIISENSLTVKGDYIEINTPNNNTSTAILLMSDELDSIDIDDNLVINPNDISKQKVLIEAGTYFVVLGKTDATMEMKSGITDITTSNVANSVKMYLTNNVTFNTNGGSEINKEVIAYGNTITKPTNPTKENYTFDGWYIDEKLTESFDFNTPITKDITLYAKWSESKKYSYEFLNGDNQELTLENIKEYTFRIDGDYSLFESLKIGNLDFIKDEDYKVTEGSTIITLLEKGIAKLKTLSKGKYEVLVMYSNGNEVKGNLILNSIENPKTGDKYTTYIITGTISLISLICTSIYTKKKLVK